jgi:hypothetical protein
MLRQRDDHVHQIAGNLDFTFVVLLRLPVVLRLRFDLEHRPCYVNTVPCEVDDLFLAEESL